MKRYVVRLQAAERDELKDLVSKGKTAAYKIRHANILLRVDADGPNWSDEQAARAFGCHLNTVRNVRQRFVAQGLEAALERKKQEKPSRQPIIDGEAEARLIKIACGQPPQGRNKWTMQLLAERMVELKVVESVCKETVRQALKKMNSSRIFASVGSFRQIRMASS